MDNLTDLYNEAILPMDAELEKQAEEMWKEAEEEDAAGRIMARGFADELNKLAQPGQPVPVGGTIKSKPFKVSGATGELKPGKLGTNPSSKITKRNTTTPSASAQTPQNFTFPEKKVNP